METEWVLPTVSWPAVCARVPVVWWGVRDAGEGVGAAVLGEAADTICADGLDAVDGERAVVEAVAADALRIEVHVQAAESAAGNVVSAAGLNEVADAGVADA